jgi:hypothetical protein
MAVACCHERSDPFSKIPTRTRHAKPIGSPKSSETLDEALGDRILPHNLNALARPHNRHPQIRLITGIDIEIAFSQE